MATKLFALATAVCLLAGCGNYSNDDLVFLAALPDRAALKVNVPRSDSQPLCAMGESSAWRGARTTGDSINGAIDGLLTLVDFIRVLPPTQRSVDVRIWGPWPDSNHPGLDTRVTITRQRAAKPQDDVFLYSFEQRRNQGVYLSVISGAFHGSDARDGSGTMVLHFDAAWTLGTTKADDPRGDAEFAYDHTSDPRTLEMELRATGGFGLKPSFRYSYAGYADGHGRFDYFFLDSHQNELTVTARFTKEGAGRADLNVKTPQGLTGHVDQCWDSEACVSYLDDPLAITQPLCGAAHPCLLGSVTACPSGL